MPKLTFGRPAFRLGVTLVWVCGNFRYYRFSELADSHRSILRSFFHLNPP